MLCRPSNHNGSDLGSTVSATSVSDRPTSADERSDYSFTSHEPISGKASPIKQDPISPASPATERDKRLTKRKSGFFQNHSPFSRRKSIKEPRNPASSGRNTWHPGNGSSSSGRPKLHGGDSGQNLLPDRATASPDPIDANADVAINVGDNVLPVKLPGRQKPAAEPEPQDDDPIAQALAELKGVAAGGKQSSVRMSADHYHGIATPAPGAQPFSRSVPPVGGGGAVAAGMRGTPPPSYDQQVQRLGVPSPAVTSRAMKETSQKYTQQTRSLFAGDRPGSGGFASPSRPGTRGNDMPRAASPAPPRSASPRPGMNNRSASPNPYAGSQRGSMNSRHGSIQMEGTNLRNSPQGFYRQNSPNDAARSASPAPFRGAGDYGRPASRGDYGRPASRAGSNYSGAHNDMPRGMSPAPTDDGYGGSTRGRGGRPGTSQGNRGISLYEPPGAVAPASRQRSKSVADTGRQYTKDGRPILHFGKDKPSLLSATRRHLLTKLLQQRVHCTCTRPQSRRSWDSARVIYSPFSATRTMVGGRPKFMEQTDTPGWSPATTCSPFKGIVLVERERDEQNQRLALAMDIRGYPHRIPASFRSRASAYNLACHVFGCHSSVWAGKGVPFQFFLYGWVWMAKRFLCIRLDDPSFHGVDVRYK